MLDFGFSEILLTSAIALVVLGPERLPKVARQVGNWMGRARAMARQLSEQLEREVNAEELLKIQNKPTTTGAASPGSGTHVPNHGAAFDPSYTQSIATPANASPSVAVPASDTQSSAASPSLAVQAPDAQPPVMTPQAAVPDGGTTPSTSGVIGLPLAAAAPATAQASDAVSPAPREPEPVFGGLPASATTPAAMHASDPHVADSKPTHE